MFRSKVIISVVVCALVLCANALGYSGGSGETGDPYQIASKPDLLQLAATTADYGKSFIMTADISLAPDTFTTAVIAPDTDSATTGFQGTAFTGVFDGDGYSITGLSINDGGTGKSFLGLFGQVGSGGTVKNLKVTNCSVTGSSGSMYTGAVVGWANSATIVDSSSSGTVYGDDGVGGFAGRCDLGSLTRCWSSANVTVVYGGGGGLVGYSFVAGGTISQCYATGNVAAGMTAGGLIGVNKSTISNSYATGTASCGGPAESGGLVGNNSGTVTKCYSTGPASGGSSGGLIGNQLSGTTTNSFWDTQTSGQNSSAGGTGKTTSEMKTLATFTGAGWDFAGETTNGTNDYWQIQTSLYPYLSFQASGTGSVAAPAFSPAGGTYNLEQNVTITCVTTGATIHYTTNGVDPTESDPVIASGSSVLVDQSMTLKAMAWASGMMPSAVTSASYNIVAATPSFSVAGGTYNIEQNVVITCATTSATIRYTTNGVDPTESDTVILSGESVYVDHSLTLKARAWRGSIGAGSVQSAAYTLTVATPAFSPAAGTYSVEQNVVITCATAGATIHYTTNGVSPTESDPVIASGDSVYVDHTLTLKAKAWKSALGPSAIKSSNYALKVASPTLAPGGNHYSAPQDVTIVCATVGATIHYTVNGSTPTESDPAVASGGSVHVTVSPATVLKAKAFKAGWTASNLVSGTYGLTVLYYVSTSGNDASDGLSPATAKLTIQAGINAASAGDVVLIADGVYTGTGNYNISFGGKAITVKSANGPQNCIIDCQNVSGRTGFKFINGEQATSVLSGVTVTRGYVPSSGSAGGILISGNSGHCSPTIENCIVVNNTGVYGAGIYTLESESIIRNCVIAGNSTLSGSATAGGGIAAQYSSVKLINCTIYGNSAPTQGVGAGIAAGEGIVIIGCVVWGNNGSQISGSAAVSYSDIQGGWAGTENINAVPCFANAAAGDYRLTCASPCINKGDPAYVVSSGEKDVYGQARASGGRVDMGAAEFDLTGQPFLGVSPAQLSFSGVAGDQNPPVQTAGVWNQGTGQIDWLITSDSAWLTVTPASGQSSGEEDQVSVSVDTSALAPGVHTGTLTVGTSGMCGQPSSVVVKLYLRSPVPVEVPSDYPTIQAAIDAVVDGDTIVVAPGTYSGTGNYDLDFKGKKITLQSQDGPATCIISCGGHRGFYFHTNEDANSIVSGFTITNGWPSVRTGGAVLCVNASPKFVNCLITGNSVSYAYGSVGAAYGGGIYCQGSSAMFVGCTISGNDASAGDISDGAGGGLYSEGGNPTLIDCVISGNTAKGGNGWDGMQTVHATEGMPGWGGGICADAITLENCLVTGNTARGGSGGYDNYGGASGGYASGGGISSGTGTIRNCTIVGNQSVGGWGWPDGIASCGGVAGGGACSNCILWGNGGDDIGSGCTIEYSCTEENVSGTGNVHTNPLFVNAATGDYRLKAGSPCVDSGDNSAVPAGVTTDLAGSPRIFDGNGDLVAVVDMGAYERQCVTNPVGDIGYDCGVEFADYAMLAGKWQQSGAGLAQDLDGSGTVDFGDLLIMCDNWLEGK